MLKGLFKFIVVKFERISRSYLIKIIEQELTSTECMPYVNRAVQSHIPLICYNKNVLCM